jgi:hypothetical protein
VDASIGRAFIERVGDLGASARLTLNFHPDRIAIDGVTVAEGLVRDGRYRSQWVTWISNGGRSATVGGDRHRWERALFGDAYERVDPLVEEMPVYGALDPLRDPHGGSPRFGSCFLVLEPHVFDRVTLTVGDSHAAPRDVGTRSELRCVLAGLVEQAAVGELLGRSLGFDELDEVLEGRYESSVPGRVLDHYVEAQVHGGVDLARDVGSVVLDPSFRGSPVEEHFDHARERYGVRVEWHPGSVLRVDDVPADFRGAALPGLARRVAGARPTIDARLIGALAARCPPGMPTFTGDPDQSELQQLKYLWHTLLANGTEAPTDCP